jgi:hypothetical protein
MSQQNDICMYHQTTTLLLNRQKYTSVAANEGVEFMETVPKFCEEV